MVKGYFASHFGRAFVRATIVLPRFGMQWELPLVVDTGADRSSIMPDDVLRIGIATDALRDRVLVAGVGGYLDFFSEPGGVLLREQDGMIQVFSLPILIADPGGSARSIPSFIGRDVLNRCRMLYDPIRERLRLKVISSDATIGATGD